MTRLEEIYAHYTEFCLDRGIDPLILARWFLLTDSLLPLPHRVPQRSENGDNRSRNPAKAATREAIKAGLFVGELRPDGSVGVVRHQTAPISEKSPLTARACRSCGEYLPVGRFTKQGKSIRAICKRCDNARRRRPKTLTD